jgi:hypothetical protein
MEWKESWDNIHQRDELITQNHFSGRSQKKRKKKSIKTFPITPLWQKEREREREKRKLQPMNFFFIQLETFLPVDDAVPLMQKFAVWLSEGKIK